MDRRSNDEIGRTSDERRPPVVASERIVRLLVLLVAGIAAFVAIDHGDPLFRDRCPDSLHPLVTLTPTTDRDGDFTSRSLAYPPLVARLIGGAQRVWLSVATDLEVDEVVERMRERARAIAARKMDVASADEFAGMVGRLIVVGRCVVAAFAVLAVFALMRLVWWTFGSRAAIVAGAIAAVHPTLAIYARTGNVDVPYVALALLALSFSASAVRTGRRLDLFLSVTLAALSICAKDQAYGLFVLTAPVVLAMFRRPGDFGGGSLRPVPYGTLIAALVTAALCYVLLPGWPIQWSWFRDHLEFLTGSGSEPFRTNERSWSGLYGVTLEAASFIASGSAFLVAPLGFAALIVATFTKLRASSFFSVPAISYLLSFLFPIGYVYLRFALSLQLLLAGMAAVAIGAGIAANLTGWPRSSRAIRALAWSVLAVVLVDGARDTTEIVRVLDAEDPRRAAQRYLGSRYEPHQRVDALLTGTVTDPILPPWPNVRVFHSIQTTPGPTPDVLVLCTPHYEDPRIEWADRRVERFSWQGEPFDEVVRFEPPFHHTLLQGVLWFPRIVFLEPSRRAENEAPREKQLPPNR